VHVGKRGHSLSSFVLQWILPWDSPVRGWACYSSCTYGHNVALCIERSMTSAAVTVPDRTNKTRNFIMQLAGSVEKKNLFTNHVSIKPLNSVYSSSLMRECYPQTWIEFSTAAFRKFAVFVSFVAVNMNIKWVYRPNRDIIPLWQLCKRDIIVPSHGWMRCDLYAYPIM